MNSRIFWFGLLILPAGQLAGQSRRPEPVIDSAICPFECCRLGPWRAESRVVARSLPATGAPVAYVISRGEVVRAVHGDLRSAHPGRLVLRAPLRNPTATFHPGVGDTILIAGYRGEGEYDWRWHGVSLGNDDFWQAVGDTSAAVQPIWIAPVNGTWWVRVLNRQGRSGWIDAGHMLSDGFGDGPIFAGEDSCAG